MTKDNRLQTIDYVFLVILFVFPFLHVASGVDLTDSGYSLGNYENLQNMDGMWVVATFLSSVLGKALTYLPGGHTWLGMNLYTSLLPAFLGTTSYLFLRQYLTKWILFVGELFALCLCWCPHVIIYNYLTYTLFTAGVIVILYALKTQKTPVLILAGFLLGTNVFVRFPNVAEALLICVVWYDCILNRRGRKAFFKASGFCLLGYFAAAALWLMIISLIYGPTAYPDMIASLFGMTKEATSYTPNGMLEVILRAYQNALLPLARVIVGTVAGIVIYSFLKPKWLKILFIVGYSAAYALFVFWCVRNWVFRPLYNDYVSILFWNTCFLMLAITVSIVSLIHKKVEPQIKVLSLAMLLVICITPLGSNTGVYPNLNHMFLMAPYTLYMLWQFLFKAKIGLKRDTGKIQWMPLRLCVIFTVVCTLFQTLVFGINFTFLDAGFPFGTDTKIEGNEVLQGMHTNAASAEELEVLTKFVDDNDFRGQKAIFFGEVPSLSYVLQMPCAISHTWPDLASYPAEQMRKELSNLTEPPLVVVGAARYPSLLEENDSQEDHIKRDLLIEYMNQYDYDAVFRSDNYMIYQAERENHD